MKIYKRCTTEPYSFLVNDTALPSDDPIRFNFLILLWEKLLKNKQKQLKIKKKNRLMVQWL